MFKIGHQRLRRPLGDDRAASENRVVAAGSCAAGGLARSAALIDNAEGRTQFCDRRRKGGVMRRGFSGLGRIVLGSIFLLAASGAKADLTFCNKFAHTIFVAIAYPQDDQSWISRGWLDIDTGNCAKFDTALRLKTFYYRGESATYRNPEGQNVSRVWGSGGKFSIWENDNFNYWNAQKQVLKASLADFSLGGDALADGAVITVTFEADGKFTTIDVKNPK
jgi:hypothetical protein